jgi:hypothetical protein
MTCPFDTVTEDPAYARSCSWQVLVELGNSIRKGMHGIQSTAINDRFTLGLSPLPQMVVDDFQSLIS